MKQTNERLKGISGELLHLKFEVENINGIYYSLQIGGDKLGYSIFDNKFSFIEEAFSSKYLPDQASKTIQYENNRRQDKHESICG